MELTFNKVGKQYEAEFELSADANLHIEFKNAAPVKLYQRTSGSGWDLVNDVKNAVGKATDVDLTSLIYPKFVKVVCVQEPTYATVTTDGEITEIKSQSKEVEVTSNGTTNVTPDAGFNYLNSVKVKTNVAQSGEGSGSASKWMYFDVSQVSDNLLKSTAGVIAMLARGVDANNDVITVGSYAFSMFPDMIKAVGVDLSAPFASSEYNYERVTMEQYLNDSGFFENCASFGFVEITEDEFLNKSFA